MFCQCGGIVNIIDPIPRQMRGITTGIPRKIEKEWGWAATASNKHTFARLSAFRGNIFIENHVWSRSFGVVAKFRTALTRPWPPDWSSPSSWLLANKGLVSMPSCGYVENCWFWAKGRDYMEGELKGDSTNSGTCAEVSLGTTDPPQFLREAMHGNALHLQNYLLEYAAVYICAPMKSAITLQMPRNQVCRKRHALWMSVKPGCNTTCGGVWKWCREPHVFDLDQLFADMIALQRDGRNMVGGTWFMTVALCLLQHGSRNTNRWTIEWETGYVREAFNSCVLDQ